MSEALKFLDGMMGEALADIHTCMLGKIKSFDGKKMQADVIPLGVNKLADGRETALPVISQAPVMFIHGNGFFIRPPLKPGDLVVVVFADRELDGVLLSGEAKAPTSERRHGLDDAIVLGGWIPFSSKLPVSNDDDLVIGNISGSVGITIVPDGTVKIEAKKITMQAGSTVVNLDGDGKTASVTALDGVTVSAPDGCVTITGDSVAIG